MDVLGYVVMPEHVHLLVSEPEEKALSVAIQILKQRFSKTRKEEYVWESRYYDFNVRSQKKRIEKLTYIHQNPVRRELVAEPKDWRWSSFRDYADLGTGPVTVTLPEW
jgi:putative transposase